MSTDPTTHLFWITSRAAGTTALVLASVSVCFGLLLGGKLLKGGGPDRRIIHETLSLSVMVAIAVHGLSLLGDSYLRPSVLDVSVPFISSYKTLPTSLGIISGWGIVFLGLSYYLRRRIGHRRWKLIHRFTVLAWLGGLAHALTEGTDAGQLWFIALVVLAAVPPLVLLAVRLRARGAPSRPHRRAPVRPHGQPPQAQARPQRGHYATADVASVGSV